MGAPTPFPEHAMRSLSRLLPVLLLVALPAAAQTAATPAAAGASTDVPKHSCGKPGEFPGGLASDNQKRNYQKLYVEYTECLRKFATEQQKLAEPHLKAANDTVNEYNAAVKTYNEEIQKSKGAQ
jgi:hypothetical protein